MGQNKKKRTTNRGTLVTFKVIKFGLQGERNSRGSGLGVS